jgi:methylase of polypeptide subunit release factors
MPSAASVVGHHRMLSRRVQREPMAYITNVRDFFLDYFAVTSDTLIPRPSSELVRHASWQPSTLLVLTPSAP